MQKRRHASFISTMKKSIEHNGTTYWRVTKAETIAKLKELARITGDKTFTEMAKQLKAHRRPAKPKAKKVAARKS